MQLLIHAFQRRFIQSAVEVDTSVSNNIPPFAVV